MVAEMSTAAGSIMSLPMSLCDERLLVAERRTADGSMSLLHILCLIAVSAFHLTYIEATVSCRVQEKHEYFAVLLPNCVF